MADKGPDHTKRQEEAIADLTVSSRLWKRDDSRFVQYSQEIAVMEQRWQAAKAPVKKVVDRFAEELDRVFKEETYAVSCNKQLDAVKEHIMSRAFRNKVRKECLESEKEEREKKERESEEKEEKNRESEEDEETLSERPQKKMKGERRREDEQGKENDKRGGEEEEQQAKEKKEREHEHRDTQIEKGTEEAEEECGGQRVKEDQATELEQYDLLKLLDYMHFVCEHWLAMRFGLYDIFYQPEAFTDSVITSPLIHRLFLDTCNTPVRYVKRKADQEKGQPYRAGGVYQSTNVTYYDSTACGYEPVELGVDMNQLHAAVEQAEADREAVSTIL